MTDQCTQNYISKNTQRKLNTVLDAYDIINNQPIDHNLTKENNNFKITTLLIKYLCTDCSEKRAILELRAGAGEKFDALMSHGSYKRISTILVGYIDRQIRFLYNVFLDIHNKVAAIKDNISNIQIKMNLYKMNAELGLLGSYIENSELPDDDNMKFSKLCTAVNIAVSLIYLTSLSLNIFHILGPSVNVCNAEKAYKIYLGKYFSITDSSTEIARIVLSIETIMAAPNNGGFLHMLNNINDQWDAPLANILNVNNYELVNKLIADLLNKYPPSNKTDKSMELLEDAYKYTRVYQYYKKINHIVNISKNNPSNRLNLEREFGYVHILKYSVFQLLYFYSIIVKNSVIKSAYGDISQTDTETIKNLINNDTPSQGNNHLNVLLRKMYIYIPSEIYKYVFTELKNLLKKPLTKKYMSKDDKHLIYIPSFLRSVLFILNKKQDPTNIQDYKEIIQLTSILRTESLGTVKKQIMDNMSNLKSTNKKLDDIITYVKVRNDNFKGALPSIRYNVSVGPTKTNRNNMRLQYLNDSKKYFLNDYNNEIKIDKDKDVSKASYDSYYFGPFDNIFGPSETNKDIASKMPEVIQCLNIGQNTCIIAYGPSGAGKTSTLIHKRKTSTGSKEAQDGILPEILNSIGCMQTIIQGGNGEDEEYSDEEFEEDELQDEIGDDKPIEQYYKITVSITELMNGSKNENNNNNYEIISGVKSINKDLSFSNDHKYSVSDVSRVSNSIEKQLEEKNIQKEPDVDKYKIIEHAEHRIKSLVKEIKRLDLESLTDSDFLKTYTTKLKVFTDELEVNLNSSISNRNPALEMKKRQLEASIEQIKISIETKKSSIIKNTREIEKHKSKIVKHESKIEKYTNEIYVDKDDSIVDKEKQVLMQKELERKIYMYTDKIFLFDGSEWVIDPSIISEYHDIIRPNIKLGEYISEVMDAVRYVKGTINNDISSRSHLIVKMELESIHKENSNPILLLCDFAGVENEFKCDSLNTQLGFKNIVSLADPSKNVYGHLFQQNMDNNPPFNKKSELEYDKPKYNNYDLQNKIFDKYVADFYNSAASVNLDELSLVIPENVKIHDTPYYIPISIEITNSYTYTAKIENNRRLYKFNESGNNGNNEVDYQSDLFKILSDLAEINKDEWSDMFVPTSGKNNYYYRYKIDQNNNYIIGRSVDKTATLWNTSFYNLASDDARDRLNAAARDDELHNAKKLYHDITLQYYYAVNNNTDEYEYYYKTYNDKFLSAKFYNTKKDNEIFNLLAEAAENDENDRNIAQGKVSNLFSALENTFVNSKVSNLFGALENTFNKNEFYATLTKVLNMEYPEAAISYIKELQIAIAYLTKKSITAINSQGNRNKHVLEFGSSEFGGESGGNATWNTTAIAFKMFLTAGTSITESGKLYVGDFTNPSPVATVCSWFVPSDKNGKNAIDMIYNGKCSNNVADVIFMEKTYLLPAIKQLKAITVKSLTLNDKNRNISPSDVKLGSFITGLLNYVVIIKNLQPVFRKVCNDRIKEGEFINASLLGLRTFLLELYKSKNNDVRFMDGCLNLQCNPITNNCFDTSTMKEESKQPKYESAIEDIIHKSLTSDMSDTSEVISNTKFCIMNVINISSNIDNPPKSPYIDLTDVVSEINRYTDKDNYMLNDIIAEGVDQTFIDQYAIKLIPFIMLENNIKMHIGQLPSGSTWLETISLFTRKKKSDYSTDLHPVLNTGISDILENDLIRLTALINEIIVHNASSNIGTMEFIDYISKHNVNRLMCRIPSNTNRKEYHSINNNLRTQYEEEYATTNEEKRDDIEYLMNINYARGFYETLYDTQSESLKNAANNSF
jgi:hypothetical protein